MGTVGEGTAELTIQRGGEEMTVRLARQFIVGSRPDADLVVAGVPPTHFVINPSKHGALMLVLEHPERVAVNGRPARQAQRLSHGDAIEVQGVRLKYSSPSDSHPEMALSREPTPRSTSLRDANASILDSQNISWFTSESDLYRALRTIYQLGSLSHAASSESALLEGALTLTMQGGRASEGAIVGRGEDGDVVPLFVRRPEGAGSASTFALDQVLVALTSGHTSVVGPPEHLPTLCAPIVRPGSQPEGALCLKRAPGAPAFTTHEVELAVSVGRQLGSALERVRVLKSLRSSSLELQPAPAPPRGGALRLSGEARARRRRPGSSRSRRAAASSWCARSAAETRGRQTARRGRPSLSPPDRACRCGGPARRLELETSDERTIRVSAARVASLEAVVLVLSDVSQQRELEDRGREAEARLLTDVVRAREQRRIGQDLHDGVCQQLVGIQMLTKGLERELALAHREESTKAGEIVALLRQATEEARSLARGLSTMALQERSFVLALEDLVTTYRRLSPHVAFSLESTGTMPPIDAEVATQLYHVVQEALSNACKHSGAAAISVDLACTPDGVVVAVADDGGGIPPGAERKGGMGLGNMRHRARRIGAMLELEPGARGGTRVVCSLRTDAEQRGGVHGA
ncbi:MAG: sensor histidine kinase [Planctomycetota bacterium]|nr:sensor histidine kinase [Planctomycetota bacterium]